MAYTVIIHIQNEDPVVAEMEKLPGPSDTLIAFTNPRKRDGKPLYYITEGSVAYLFPLSRIAFIEVMASEAEEQEIISFFR
jgi:hypothetical protein